MKKIFFLLLALSQLLWAEKVLYALTSGDYDTVQRRLVDNVEKLEAYYKRQGKSLEVAVVIYGNAYGLVKKQQPASDAAAGKHAQLRAGLERLHARYGVQFDICSAGMKKRKIAPGDIYSFVHPVFNKDAGLIKWQNRGYAYIEIE